MPLLTRPAPAPPAPARSVPGRPPLWRRRLLRHRRPLAAVLAALLAWSLVTALRPEAASTSSVLVAARDLAPGTVVAQDDVVGRAVPVDAVPTDSVPADAPGLIVGRTVVVPLMAGEPVLARHLLTGSLLQGYGAGTVATPVRLSDDAAAGVVRPGDLVDVVAAVAGGADGTTAGARATVVASGVRVLLAGGAVATSGDGGALSLAATGDRTSSVVVLATTTEQGLAIARAAVGSRLSVVLRAD